MTPKDIDNIFQTLQKINPYPQTELKFTNNFTLLVAIILSAQATDVSVNKATAGLFSIYDNPEDFVKLGEEGLKQYIKTIGLYNAKAANIITMSKNLIAEYDSKVPNTYDELIKLPGVGSKTANVFLNCAFGEPVIAVDTHVLRVAYRLGLTSANTPKKVGRELANKIPDRWKKHAHHWLILHGRYICKARKPDCLHCPISTWCKYFRENKFQVTF